MLLYLLIMSCSFSKFNIDLIQITSEGKMKALHVGLCISFHHLLFLQLVIGKGSLMTRTVLTFFQRAMKNQAILCWLNLGHIIYSNQQVSCFF